MTVHGFEVFDGDGHVLESDDELAQYYEGQYAGGQRMNGLSIFPSLDGWSRGPMLAKEDSNRKYWHTDAAVWGGMPRADRCLGHRAVSHRGLGAWADA